MRFYNRQHRHYCGIDLHVKTVYVWPFYVGLAAILWLLKSRL